jgi:hypothetical protein
MGTSRRHSLASSSGHQWGANNQGLVSWALSITELYCGVSLTQPPLWSSGQSSWLQVQRSGFDYRHYQIFWEVVGLERGPLSLVSTIEELLGRKSGDSSLENREYGRRDPLSWPRGTLYPQKLAITSPTSGGRSVGIVRLRTHATEVFSVCLKHVFIHKHTITDARARVCACVCLRVWSSALAPNKKKKLHGLSPRANYTDRATAASRRSVANLCG